MGSKAAVVLQLNATGEASFGTTGTANVKLHGVREASFTIKEETEVVPAVGWYGPGPVGDVKAQSGEGNIEMTLTYEDFPRILNGLFTAIGASTVTSGSPYNYPYTAPVSSTQVCHTYTLENGTTNDCYHAVGSVFNGMTVRGEAGGFWEATVPVIAKQIVNATGGVTASLASRTVNPIRMANTTLYMDAFSTGTMGGTSVSAILIDFELGVNANRHMKQFAGSVYPSNWGDGKMEGTLKLTLEFSSDAKALVNALLSTSGSSDVSMVKRQIRLGAAVGSSASVKAANLDFAGALAEPVKLWDDREGNLIVETNWAGMYSTGLTNWFVTNVQMGSSSLTT